MEQPALLRMMGRSTNERITVDLCLRTGSKALLGGAISTLGSHYLIDLNAVACNSGNTLAKEQVEAASKEAAIEVLEVRSTEGRLYHAIVTDVGGQRGAQPSRAGVHPPRWPCFPV